MIGLITFMVHWTTDIYLSDNCLWKLFYTYMMNYSSREHNRDTGLSYTEGWALGNPIVLG